MVGRAAPLTRLCDHQSIWRTFLRGERWLKRDGVDPDAINQNWPARPARDTGLAMRLDPDALALQLCHAPTTEVLLLHQVSLPGIRAQVNGVETERATTAPLHLCRWCID